MPAIGTLNKKQVACLAGLAPMARQILHPGWPQAVARRALHTLPRRNAIQSWFESQIHRPHQSRKTRKSRAGRPHAKAYHPRKHADPGGSEIGENQGLIKTDTPWEAFVLVLSGLSSRSGCPCSRLWPASRNGNGAQLASRCSCCSILRSNRPPNGRESSASLRSRCRAQPAHSQVARFRFKGQPLQVPQEGHTKPSGQRCSAR
jgi:hypothetical protein